MILDTSLLIDLMASDRAAVSLVEDLEDRGVPQRVPAHVLYELYAGVGYSDTSETERDQIVAAVESRPIVETTAAIARLAGRIDGELRAAGRRVESGDVLIGAVARQYDEPVATTNPDDFERLPEVAVRSY